jgi:hypothetical protein
MKIKIKPSFRCIFTSTTENDEKEFIPIKKHFMGTDKALVIRLQHDVN